MPNPTSTKKNKKTLQNEYGSETREKKGLI